jgi:hypothetical protein
VDWGLILTTSIRVIWLRTSEGLSHSPEHKSAMRPESRPALAKAGHPGFCLKAPTARTSKTGDCDAVMRPPMGMRSPDFDTALNHNRIFWPDVA